MTSEVDGLGADPPYLYPDYVGTRLRAPLQALVRLERTVTETTAPHHLARSVRPTDHDLTSGHGGEPVGERIIVTGRVMDTEGHPLRGQAIEVWQANAAGRYHHAIDQHRAPIDPNFTGEGRCVTDGEGFYRFITIRPGAYPWRNHPNAWRPAHIHFSLVGGGFASRLVTQMYFPDDPLLSLDPILNSIPDARAAARLVCSFDIAATEPEWALAFRFDIVLRGTGSTPLEGDG
jgi:protocatechuate 3,4-dioxygenase beta subunit